MLQAKDARSPLGKTDPLVDMTSKQMSSGQQQSFAAVPQAAAVPVTLTPARSALAASPRQLQDPLPSELASGKQAPLQSLALASHQSSTPLALPSARQVGSAAGAAQAHGLTKPLSSVQSSQLTSSDAASPSRQRRDPSPAELALAKQKSLGSPNASAQDSAQAFVLSPRQKRDPSPAELGLIRHQSGTSVGQHHESHLTAQKRDPSPAELGLIRYQSGIPLVQNHESYPIAQKRDPSPAELGLIRHQSGTSMVQHHESLPMAMRMHHSLPCPD